MGLTATEKPLSVRKCGEVPSVEDSGWVVVLKRKWGRFRSLSLREHANSIANAVPLVLRR